MIIVVVTIMLVNKSRRRATSVGTYNHTSHSALVGVVSNPIYNSNFGQSVKRVNKAYEAPYEVPAYDLPTTFEEDTSA